MSAVVLHDRVAQEGESPDHLDVLVQAESVSAALRELGRDPVPLSASLDLSGLRTQLQELRPSFVFNLVESIEGQGRLIYLAPALMDCMGIPYTGSGTEAVYLTSNKLAAKKVLISAGIRTPRGFSSRDLQRGPEFAPGPYIIKSIWEHASIGLDEESVVTPGGPEELLERLLEREERLGVACFAEPYIEGREFNLSMLETDGGVQVLPPAEIRFDHFPEEKRKIVGYRAKWEEGSFEYLHTVRSFEFQAADRPLLEALSLGAVECWHLFDLRGYARVDFRVDAGNRPWILEVNVNPCLSPDAGFAAATAKAGLTFTEVVERIVRDCESVEDRSTSRWI
jgi:D-alanine-D-alanine ligase